jgi:diguanylate cyclase (GGDEF)-like protein/PAS domain S-box-containing protein
MTRILHLEDDPADSEITRHLLLGANLACELQVVATRKEYVDALQSSTYDVILADHRLPDLDGFSALHLAREFAPATPFIVLAGTIGEEAAVEALKRGATDFVLKDRPLRLASSIQRALREAEIARARRTAEEAAAAASRRYLALYEENPCIYFTLDSQGTLLSVNRFGAEQLGYTREELVGRRFSTLYSESDRDTAERLLAAALTSPEQTHRWELRKATKSGSLIWMRDSARVTRSDNGEPMVLIVSEDTTETWELSEELYYRTTHDDVTGLLNRREFERRLKSTLDESRHEDIGHSLCYLDLDRFKVLNDNCGHLAGDELLRQIAARLKITFRRHDLLARVGGDEFAILMKHCTPEEAQQAAERVLADIREMSFEWEGRRFTLSACIGTVPLGRQRLNHQAIMAAAEAACEIAKGSGGNRIHIHSEADRLLLQQVGDSRWVPRITDAIANDLFFLEYQRILPLHPGHAEGEHFELLVRLREGDGQVVLPSHFLPAAERYNVCSAIDQWVVGAALRWLAAPGTPLDRVGLCSINLSARTLSDMEFQAWLQNLLGVTSVPTQKLCFEITETAAITNTEQAQRFVAAIKALGCKFAVDDFGSGMASFAYLKRLPVDFVKIDGLFVRDILSDPFSLAMVRSICEVARAGGMRTVAEFAANQETVERLREIGVDYAQGYGIAKPAPLSEFTGRDP